MPNLKSIGFDIIYPLGCKEVHEGLKLDELKRRLEDLMKCLENMSEDYQKGYDSLLCETRIDESDSIIQTETKSLNLQGLLLHLSCEQFVDHYDRDVQLRVAACLCYIIKIACPKNPFLCYTDSEDVTKAVLHFLLKCVKELSRFKSKKDKLFLTAHTILSICCEIDIFHFYTTISDGDKLLAECFHVFFDVIRRSAEWGDDQMLAKIITDAMINLLSSSDANVPEALVTYLLNILVDRCSSKAQKQVVLEIFTKCISKLEEQIQMVLQNFLITNEKEEEAPESSDNDEGNNVDDDICSLDSYKLRLKKSEKIKAKPGNKVEAGKNTIEPNIEYGFHHVFQMIYEMFQISESIVTPLLPTIEMKLRSNHKTDRKRACRLIGKLFLSSAINDNSNHGSLWETFLGRLCDIELEVREICVRVARDLLKSALEFPDKCGIMAFSKEREELVKAFQKRSKDQEESIRYLIVIAVSQILEHSKSIVHDEELDVISEAMHTLLLHQSRDQSLSVRKEAHSTMSKLYRKIVSAGETRASNSGEIDLTLGLKNLRQGQKSRVERLLNVILRPYLSAEVDDRIVVERLFNTSLVPYGQDSSQRMKSLLQCLTLCDETSVLCIHEMFKTQVSVMNLVRQTMDLIGPASKDSVLSPALSQKLVDKVKKLSEYLSGKDKIVHLTKLFNRARLDSRLNELLRRFVKEDTARAVIVKTITEIKNHLAEAPSKAGGDNSGGGVTATAKRKAFVNSVKCVLERGAPVIFDGESVQELLSHCVSTREAMEASSMVVTGGCVVPLSRTLRLLHTMLIMSRRLVPVTETYEYLISVVTTIDEGLGQQTPRIEDLCLTVLAKMVEHSDSDDHTLSAPSFTDPSVVAHTQRLLEYLTKCCLEGSGGGGQTLLSVTRTRAASKDEHQRPQQQQQPLPHYHHHHGTDTSAKWSYDCKLAKLAAQCLVGLYRWCQSDQRRRDGDPAVSSASMDHDGPSLTTEDAASFLPDHIQTALATIIKKCTDSERFSEHQPVMLTSLTHISILLNETYDHEVRTYATEVIPRLLQDDSDKDPRGSTTESVCHRNLTLWQPDSEVTKVTQVRIQALKLLSRWVVTLKADVVADQKCIVYVMSSLRKYIGNYGTEGYSGDTRDSEMSHLRLAAGKCWLRVAQVQSFLPIFDVKWIHRLSSLVHDTCPQVRDEFLRKLHIGLYKLKLPLEYMAMFVFVSKVKSQDYLNTARKYLQTNITRRRDFLDTYKEYLADAKKLFGLLPEYVLSFVIHMLAHDPDWKNIDDDESLGEVKQCLWFVMEPILKMKANYSFIRKLLERIKHAQDSAEPNNAEMNEKLYICSDIALGLLISKQTTFDLIDYPVELKLPRTRYVSAPNTFFNPDFSNILLDNFTRPRIQFSPIPKSKQTLKNCMPALLIKGSHSSHDNKADDRDITTETNQHVKQTLTKAKKHTAKIVMGVPEMESEVVAGHSVQASTHEHDRKDASSKRKRNRSDTPNSDKVEMSASQGSVTQRGRIIKPNVRVMKDMVSPTKKESPNSNKTNEISPIKKRIVAATKKHSFSPTKKSMPKINATKETPHTSTHVRLEGNVSINIERLISDVVNQTMSVHDSNLPTNGDKSPDKAKNITKKRTSSTTKKRNTRTENNNINVFKENYINSLEQPNKVDSVTKKNESKDRGKKRKEKVNDTSEGNVIAPKTKRLTRHSILEIEPVPDSNLLEKDKKQTKRCVRNAISKSSQEIEKKTQVESTSVSNLKSSEVKERITRKSALVIEIENKAFKNNERNSQSESETESTTQSSPNKKILLSNSVSATASTTLSSPPNVRITRNNAYLTDAIPKSSQEIKTTSRLKSTTESTNKSSQEQHRTTGRSTFITNLTPKSGQEQKRTSRNSASITDSTPKSTQEQERTTRHSASITDSTPKSTQERKTRHSASITDSTPKSTQERTTRHSASITDSTPKSTQERTTRHSASITDSTHKSTQEQERTTRRSAFITNLTPKSPKDKSVIASPDNRKVVRPIAKATINSPTKSNNELPSPSQAQKEPVKANPRKVAIVKSPLEVIIRSKRMASVFASEELLKKAKIL